jgi:glutamate--cysteine ligase catalytic subunit
MKPKPLEANRFQIPKSRYDSISLFLSQDPSMQTELYNDIDPPFDAEIFRQLSDNGVDSLLAKHISHLFIRDPLVIYKELLQQDIQTSSDHFENIQSTNWQTMRFKPPPANSTIGWRVEFRSMEIQLTDFENAAFSVFIVLLSRAILSLGLNFYIPISKVDENMQLAQQRDAINRNTFHFRNSVFNCTQPLGCSPLEHDGGLAGLRNDFGSPMPTINHMRARNGSLDAPPDSNGIANDSCAAESSRMTINEIINGCPRRNFPGLIPLIELYLGSMETDGIYY